MKKIFKQLEHFVDEYIIHPKLHANVEQLGRARFVSFGLLASSLFVASHWFFIEVSGAYMTPLKTFCNAAGTILGIICLLIIRFTGSLNTALFLNLILGMFFVVASSYNSGGIYSVDAFWLIILSMVSFMFLERNGGIIVLLLCAGIYTWYYIADINEVRDFRYDNMAGGAKYDYVNLIVLLLFTSVVTYFYVSELNKTRAKLKELKDRQMANMGDRYKFITDNANDIIAVHEADGKASYVSPSAKRILGFDTVDLLGTKYNEIVGFSLKDLENNQLVSCDGKNGERIYLEIAFSKIENELSDGNVLISMARDVTDKINENSKIEKLREQIANDFHDEMGNKLAAITLNANLLSHQMAPESKAGEYLSKIEDTSKSLYQNSRDFIWSIDAKSDVLSEIFVYLKDFGEDFSDSLNIKFQAQSPLLDMMSNIQLPMYFGRHIILIFKEAITNAAKHSECTEINFAVRIENEQVVFALKDNGKGFTEEEIKNGKGLHSMRKRAEAINCEITMSSQNGTEISLAAPLPK